MYHISAKHQARAVVAGRNSQAELEKNLGAVAKDAKVDEKLLDRYLKAGQGREKLREMLEDRALDIRRYAKRSLND